MQKKYYTAPEADIEKFTISDVFTNSNDPDPYGGSGDGENDGGEF
jgi:hypothetical protein